jgi:outer membrane biosynthesis protein TonB
VAQVYRRWERPSGNVSLKAEVFFLVHRDGTISNLRFVSRSGSFAFDLEAQGAIEAAATSGGFGSLPDGFTEDVLPVSFFFDPQKVR